jgi:hypothetical protein
MRLIRVGFVFTTIVITLACAAMPARAQTDDLYTSTFVVTGTGERNRAVGIARCFGDVLIKLTGDQTIVKGRRYKAVVERAASYVRSFGYRDLFAGRPIHDEQGSYDRPHALTVVFDREKMDRVARSLSREPWLAPRPRIVVLLGADNGKTSFMLSADGTEDHSADMREAFLAAAQRVAMQVAFPTRAELSAYTAATMSADAATAIARNHDAIAVTGRMVFSDKVFGWIAEWRMSYGGRSYRWSVSGVNFDAAFRNAMLGAAQIASGHGALQRSR